jgi:hypothetical protein
VAAHRSVVARRRAARGGSVVLSVLLALAAVAGCGLASKRGVELGQLRDLARRVEGGGAECPMSLPERHLRPSTVDRDAPVVPLRTGGHGSDAAIGEGLPGDDDVRITCRYAIGDATVTVEVVGVTKGHAITAFADDLKQRGDGGSVLTFIDVNANLPVGRASTLPGEPPAAFARVAAATGDVALVLSVGRAEPDAALPTKAEVERNAEAIAAALAD